VCLRGASAVEKLLEQRVEAKVRVFAVWEPILPTDWSAPTTFALRRLSDQRVRQFWDKDHAMAKAMAASRDPDSKPDCCDRRGVLWDLIAVYPAGAVWEKRLPPATVFNGPVVRVVARSKIL
jgi:hypothetical protein